MIPVIELEAVLVVNEGHFICKILGANPCYGFVLVVPNLTPVCPVNSNWSASYQLRFLQVSVLLTNLFLHL